MTNDKIEMQVAWALKIFRVFGLKEFSHFIDVYNLKLELFENYLMQNHYKLLIEVRNECQNS
jgi:hypothetical protein